MVRWVGKFGWVMVMGALSGPLHAAVVVIAGADPNSYGFSGDAGAATQARLAQPMGGAFDGAGNYYFADNRNHRIRRIDEAGIITTVAGSGNAYPQSGSFFGDGGAATSATLNRPEDVEVASDGSLYIADTQNQRVRKVAPDGTISTVFGIGVPGPSGPWCSTFDCDDGAPALQAITTPLDLEIHPLTGELYILEAQRIRKVDASGHAVTVTRQGFAGISFDRQGTLYAVDRSQPNGSPVVYRIQAGEATPVGASRAVTAAKAGCCGMRS